MNYLGHAFLSFGQAGLITGNMAGDHVKGKLALQRYPAEIARGIMLHRHIDTFTDNHPALLRARLWFRQDYGLYAAALIDNLMDHFLANDPAYFRSADELKQFTTTTYELVARDAAHFPEAFAAYFPYMRGQDWLFQSRNLQGVQRSLQGLKRRAAHMPDVVKAYEIFIGHYYQLAQCYYEFIEDAVRYVKVALNEQAGR